MKSFAKQALRARLVRAALVVVTGAGLLWGKGFFAGDQRGKGEHVLPAGGPQPLADGASVAAVDLSETQAGALVKVGRASMRDFQVVRTAVGAIAFDENMLVKVFAQYPGKIQKAFQNIGDDVKQGDILFTIDSPDLLQAESTLLAAAGALKLQTRTLARLTGLLTAGGSAQRDVDQSTSDEQTAEGNFKSARDVVRIFGKTDAEIDQILANRRIDSTLTVRSPISGRIVARSAAPGALTQPGTEPAPFTIADVSTMWMIANVIETDAPAYKVGQAVEVAVPAYPDRMFKGHVTSVGSIIDPVTRRELVRSDVDDSEHLLRSGMYATFVIRVGDPAHSLAVPEAGVAREGDGSMSLWVTTDNRHFIRRTVTTGIRQDGWVQILNGLMEGETVVSEGAVFLSNKLVLGDAG